MKTEIHRADGTICEGPDDAQTANFPAPTILIPKPNQAIGSTGHAHEGKGEPGIDVYINFSTDDPRVWHASGQAGQDGKWRHAYDSYPYNNITIVARHGMPGIGWGEISEPVTYSVFCSPPEVKIPPADAPLFDVLQIFEGIALPNSTIEIEAFNNATPSTIHKGTGTTNAGEWGLDWRIRTNWTLTKGVYTLNIRQVWGEFTSDWATSERIVH